MLPSRRTSKARGYRDAPIQERRSSPKELDDEQSAEMLIRSSRTSSENQEHPHSSRVCNERHPSESYATESCQKILYKPRKRNLEPEDLGLECRLAIKQPFPTRPAEGTCGKRIKLISNCFSLKVPSGNVYHYDVSIIKKGKHLDSEEKNTALVLARASHDKKYRCLSTKKNREIITLMLSTNPLFIDVYAAYDGQKNLYTRNPLHAHFPIKNEVILPNENGDPGNPDGPRQETFEVEIKPVKKRENDSCTISLDLIHAFFDKKITSVPLEGVMALETILRHGPCLRFTPIGNSFFYPPNLQNMHPLGGGLEVWFGYHQSVRLGQWGPMVNLDRTATTFYQKGPLVCYIAELINTSVGQLRRMAHLPVTDMKRISNKLKNLRIEVTHVRNYRRKYRILKLVKESANRLEFDMNGRTVTVAAYFRERYGRILEYQNLPCLQVYPENKKRYLPIEVCEVLEGQHCKQKLSNKQTSEMIKFTSCPPRERFSEIRDIVNLANMNNDRSIHGFGLEVLDTPLHLEGRVLDSPHVLYKDGKKIKPKDGVWNMIGSKFLRGAVVDSWVVLYMSHINHDTLKRFINMLIKIGNEMGISIRDPNSVDFIDISKCDMKHTLSKVKTKYKADLVIIVISEDDKRVYGKIKQAAETVIGLATQCIKEQNVFDSKKCSPQLVANLCQKINAKMGGINNSLEPGETPAILRKPVIIIGADVNHPGLSNTLKPSLAACVGSLDSKISQFSASLRAQSNVDERKKAIEIISDLKNMVVELLRAFFRNTKGKKPEKIIFYRDGVSEGQFEKVRDHEVTSIREACKTLEDDYEPGITFIIVQKRHHTRFMLEDSRMGVGKMNNIPPGTTVDNVVTHPVNFDFFLNSHYGIKGTSRPSHYTVLEDDNKFTADDLQKLTYQLCHTYARCTRSISIPVPVAYADLAAYRARVHLEANLEESTSSSDSSSGSDCQPVSQAVIDAIKVIIKSMYFV